tara:strand:- start:146 stop:583 length:438 start_codon:yes stop_codon:yes gene_type:complete
MAKVGRAARVASRQRVETVDGNKTIESAETGELYIVTAAATITLPAAQDGAYFKFVVGADIENSATALKISAAAAGIMQGGVSEQLHNTAPQLAHGSNNQHMTVNANGGSNILKAGSVVECVCDGTNWFVTGRILTSGTVAASFS